jgi:hypothetical protein
MKTSEKNPKTVRIVENPGELWRTLENSGVAK